MAVRAGERLKQLRLQLGLTTRDVAELSRKIAAGEANEEFAVSHARLIQIENDESTPSIYKLFTLSAVYGRTFMELVSFYVDPARMTAYRMSLPMPVTREVSLEPYDESRSIHFPVRFDPGFQVGKTNLLSRMIAAVRLYRARRLYDVPIAAPGLVRADRRSAEAANPCSVSFRIRTAHLVSGITDRLHLLVVRVIARPPDFDPPSAFAVPDPGPRLSQ